MVSLHRACFSLLSYTSIEYVKKFDGLETGLDWSIELFQLGIEHKTSLVKTDNSTMKIACSINKNWELDPFSILWPFSF